MPGRMTFFDTRTAPLVDDETMVPSATAPEVEALLAEAGVDLWPAGSEHIGRNRVLHRAPGDVGLSLLSIRFAPGYVHRRHSHDSDCVYYFVSGTGTFGARTVGPGEGVFIPADQPYKFTVGPEGCVVLEFRARSTFTTSAHPESPEALRARADAIERNAASWAAFHASRDGLD